MKLECGNVVEYFNDALYLIPYGDGKVYCLSSPGITNFETKDINIDDVRKVYQDHTLSKVIWENDRVGLTVFEREFLKNIDKKFKFLIRCGTHLLIVDEKEKLVPEGELSDMLAFMLALDYNTIVIDIDIFGKDFLRSLKESEKYEIAKLIEE